MRAELSSDEEEEERENEEEEEAGSRKARLFGASRLAEGACLARLNCASLKTSSEALEQGVVSPCA